jgi:hypothetical protein
MAIPSMGHTLGPVIADMEKLTGVEARRIHVDKGYRGHNHPHRFRVWISGQVRRVTASIRREMKRRAAVEPVIGHVKAEHRMDRNYLKGRLGDRINAVLAAAGYNFGLLLRWLAELLRVIIRAFIETVPARNIAQAPRRASSSRATRYITSGAAVGRLLFCVRRPTRRSDRALFRDDGSPRRRRSGRGRRDGEHDPRVPALGPVLGIELLVGLQVEISLHLSHGKQKSDLRTDPDNPRLKGDDAITGPTIAGDLIIKIPGQSDRELLGQKL